MTTPTNVSTMSRRTVHLFALLVLVVGVLIVDAQSCQNGGVPGRCVANASLCSGVAFAGLSNCVVCCVVLACRAVAAPVKDGTCVRADVCALPDRVAFDINSTISTCRMVGIGLACCVAAPATTTQTTAAATTTSASTGALVTLSSPSLGASSSFLSSSSESASANNSAAGAGLDQLTTILIAGIIAGCVLITLLLVVFFFVRRRRRNRSTGGISVDNEIRNPVRDLTPERPPSPGPDILQKVEEQDKLRYTSAPPINDGDDDELGDPSNYTSLSAHRLKYDVVVDN